jgi:uncharacterized protein (DUF433 family)
MEPALERRHIEVTPGVCGGKPRIAGHRIRVQDIVLWTEEGESPETIVSDFPQLTLADVHAALAYYFDHQQQIDDDIRNDEAFAAKMRAQAAASRGAKQSKNGGDPLSS